MSKRSKTAQLVCAKGNRLAYVGLRLATPGGFYVVLLCVGLASMGDAGWYDAQAEADLRSSNLPEKKCRPFAMLYTEMSRVTSAQQVTLVAARLC